MRRALGATSLPSSTVVCFPRHARKLQRPGPPLHVAFREDTPHGPLEASVVPQSEQASPQEDWDPFYTAGLRLQALLSEAGW